MLKEPSKNVFTQIWLFFKKNFTPRGPKILPLDDKNQSSISAITTVDGTTTSNTPSSPGGSSSSSSTFTNNQDPKTDLSVGSGKKPHKKEHQNVYEERLVNLIASNNQNQSNIPDLYTEITELLDDGKKSVVKAVEDVLEKYKELENLTELLKQCYKKVESATPVNISLRIQMEQALVSRIFEQYKLLNDKDPSISAEDKFKEFQSFNTEIKSLLNNKSLSQPEIKYLVKSSFTIEELRMLASGENPNQQLNKQIIEKAIVQKAIETIDNVSQGEPRVLKTLEYLQQNIGNNISIKETEKVIEEIGCRQEQHKVNITPSVWRNFLSEQGINKEQGEILNSCIEWLDSLDKHAMYTIKKQDDNGRPNPKYIEIRKDIDKFLESDNISNKREIFNWMYFMVLYKFRQLGQEQNNNDLFVLLEKIATQKDTINAIQTTPGSQPTAGNMYSSANSSSLVIAMDRTPVDMLMNQKKNQKSFP